MIYITGDTHGEMERFHDPALRKLKKDDTLIICGDFGFLWDGGPEEEKNLKKLGKKKYGILFLDGTHENFDLLKKYPLEEWNGGKVQHICGGLYHLMRGQIYTLEGHKIFTLGGGESLEKFMRIAAKKWWACELPSQLEMQEGWNNLQAAGMEVDYIVTHEPPPKADFTPAGLKSENHNQLEAFLEQIMKHVKYKKWFFGAQHIDRKITYKNYAVFSNVIPVEPPERGKHIFGK